MASAVTNIVLITGANQGLGYQIAKRLLKEHPGYHVIMTGRRLDALDAAAKTLADEGLTATETLALDVLSDDSIAAAARQVDAKHGRLDVLINNAGVGSVGDGKLSWRDKAKLLYDINVLGAVGVMDAFIPLLEKSKTTKRVVWMGSTIGSMGLKLDTSSPIHHIRSSPLYAASKPGMHWWASEYAARYWQDPTWKINANCPGYCATNLNNYEGGNSAESGAVNAVRLATLGPSGETGTFSDTSGPQPW